MFVAQRQAAQVVLGVRRVHRDDEELVELGGDDAAFLGAVALQLVGEREALGEVLRKAIDDIERLVLGEDRGARIALLDGGVPILVIAGQVDLDLAALGLGFLQAQDVRLMALQMNGWNSPFFRRRGCR